MSTSDCFGSQSPLELLTQILNIDGLYDKTQSALSAIKGVSAATVCLFPLTGGNRVSHRLTALFTQQAFSKLLLVLAVLSFAARPKTRASYVKGNLYYDTNVANNDGIVRIDNDDFQKQTTDPFYLPESKKKIEDFLLLKSGTAPADAKATPVADTEDDFIKLKTSKQLTSADTTCGYVDLAYTQLKYDLLGYSIKTQASADIAPSITYIVKNGVTSIEIQNIPSNLT
ncbi:MAG: hypothetical protein EZS28_025927, partial [Streblomastix strix]